MDSTDEKENKPETSYLSDNDIETPKMKYSEYLIGLNNLYEALPNEIKSETMTEEQIIIEAANYALDLEDHLKINRNISFDLKHETFSFPSVGEIKRPRNGFIRFATKYRTEMTKKFPKCNNRDISCLLGKKWKEMTEEERKPYEEEFKEDLKKLRESHPNWMYTPKKYISGEEFNRTVLPTRLRPEEKRKKKVFEFFEEIDLPLSHKKMNSQSSHRKKKPRKKKTCYTKIRIKTDNAGFSNISGGNITDTTSTSVLSSSININELLINPDRKSNICAHKRNNPESFSMDWENQIMESIRNPISPPWMHEVDPLIGFATNYFFSMQGRI